MNTDKLHSSLKDILINYFDAEVINKESYVQSNKIKSKIADFTNGTFDWVQKDSLFKDLKSTFPDYVLDNQTHFFYNDRCLRVYALINQDNFYSDYAIRVSIFNFFSVVCTNYVVENAKNLLQPVIFFNPGENNFADKAFNILIKYYPEIVWLSKEILIEPVFKLDVFNKNIRKDILLNDVLFTVDT